jgi:hypothetical protein
MNYDETILRKHLSKWNAINYGKAFEENKRAEFVEAIKQLCEK